MPLRSDDECLEAPLDTAARAVRERLLAMLRNLGQLLGGSLDQKITAKFRRFGGSLLNQVRKTPRWPKSWANSSLF